MGNRPTSAWRNALAVFCHHCPICAHARNKPDSVVGRILHHPLHAEHCPAWKAERERYSRTDQETNATG